MADSFPSSVRIRSYLRAKGLVGEITVDFEQQIAWDLLGASLGQALRDTGVFAADAIGAQSYIDGLLAIGSPAAAQGLPADHPIRRVSRRAVELVNARIDAVLTGEDG